MRSALIFAVLLIAALVACTQFAAASESEDLSMMEDVAIASNVTPMSEILAAEEYFAESETESLGTCKKTTAALNVRSGPSTGYSILRTLPVGTQVDVIGSSNGWAQIGSGQYVSEQYLGACSGGGGNRCSFSAPLFKQCGQSWSSNLMASQTICQVGCLMSSISMGMNRFGKTVNGQSANPGTLNAYLRAHGGYTSGSALYWGVVPGISYQGQTSDIATIRNRVCQGNTIVALNLKSRGHWVLATGVNSNGDFLVNDPGFSDTVLAASNVNVAGVYSV